MKDHIKKWDSATWAGFLPSVKRSDSNSDSDIADVTLVYEQKK